MLSSMRLLSAIAGWIGLIGPGHTETTLCTPLVPPLSITSPGSYCLFSDYALNLPSGAAITVAANNVVIDFNGHRIGNTLAGTGNSAYGLFAGLNIQNLVVRNGTLRGFHRGIYIDVGGSGHLIEDMLIYEVLFTGINLRSNSSIVQRNRIYGTGSTSTRNEAAFGMQIAAYRNQVLDNDIMDTRSVKSDVYGIYVSDGHGAVISGNRISGLTSGPIADEYGIYSKSGPHVVRGNTVVDDQMPRDGNSVGIWALISGTTMVDNVVSVQGTAYQGGTQIAGTNY